MRRSTRAALRALAAALLLGAGVAEVGAQDTASVKPIAGTPRFLVTGYRPQVDRNVAAGDTVAHVLQRRIRIDTLWVLSSRTTRHIVDSPYESGSDRLSDRDLRALGRMLRADFVLDVAVSSDPGGVRLFAELFWTHEMALPAETLTRRSLLPIAAFDVPGPTVARAAESLVDRLLLDAAALGLRRGPPR